uniref:CSON007138 protein n=1 Tax=Culicoides sonorensis TaxID=179676 RepID=A0A336M1B0_CULSO
MALMNYSLPFGAPIGPSGPNWNQLASGFQPVQANAVNGLIYDPALHQQVHPPLAPDYYQNNPYAPPAQSASQVRQYNNNPRTNNNYLPPHRPTTTKTHPGYPHSTQPHPQFPTSRTYAESSYSSRTPTNNNNGQNQQKNTQYFNSENPYLNTNNNNNNNKNGYPTTSQQRPSSSTPSRQRPASQNNNSNNNRQTINSQNTNKQTSSNNNKNNNNNSNKSNPSSKGAIPERPGGYIKVQAGEGKNTQNVAVIDYDTDDEDDYYYDDDEDPIKSPPNVTPIQGPIFLGKNGTVPVVPLVQNPALPNSSFVQIPDQSDFKYQVSIRLKYLETPYGNGYICSGTLISPRTVLTSAQCVYSYQEDKIRDPKEFRVVLGSLWRTKFYPTLLERDVSKITIHKDFDRTSSRHSNDVAVLRLILAIPQNAIDIAPLRIRNSTNTNALSGRVSSWGDTSKLTPLVYADVLTRIDVTVQTADKCRTIAPTLSVDQICVTTNTNGSTCNGDLGAPFVAFNELVGFVTHEKACNYESGQPIVITSAAYHKKWIDTNHGLSLKSMSAIFLIAISFLIWWTALSVALGLNVRGDVIRGAPCIKRNHQLFCPQAGSQYPKDKIEAFIDDNKALMKRMYGDFEMNEDYGNVLSQTKKRKRNVWSGSDGFEPDWAAEMSGPPGAGPDPIREAGPSGDSYFAKIKRGKRQSRQSGRNRGNAAAGGITGGTGRVDACESKVEIVTPYWASNSAGKIRAIVNTQHFEQAIHQEVCTNVQTSRCSGDCGCEQKYKWHRLLAYDPDNDCKGIFMDWFLFPSCCVCRCDK